MRKYFRQPQSNVPAGHRTRSGRLVNLDKGPQKAGSPSRRRSINSHPPAKPSVIFKFAADCSAPLRLSQKRPISTGSKRKRAIRRPPFPYSGDGTDWKSMPPVRRACDAGPLIGMGGKEKGRSGDRPFLIPVTGLTGSPCRPSGALATPDPLKGHGRQTKRAIRRPPFLNPVTGLIRSPCRPCRRPALPASERPSSEARRSWLRW